MLFSIPLIVLMVLSSSHTASAALAFAVATDVLAALTMGAISWKASLETLIIAIFVVVGVRVASLISAKVF
jgi:hypothetical protein